MLSKSGLWKVKTNMLANNAVSPRQEMPLRCSGHESFFCRTGWCIKLYEYCKKDGTDDDGALMFSLGIGINMVHSIRFWGEALGLFEIKADRIRATEFGEWLLNPDNGYDPYLDSKDSLWLLHWRLCFKARMAGWHSLFYSDRRDWRLGDLFREALSVAGKTTVAESTIRQHISILISTYSVQNEKAKANDNFLVGQLVPLGLIDVSPFAGETQIKIVQDAADTISSDIWVIIFLDFCRHVFPEAKTISRSFLEKHPLSPVKAVPVSPGALSKLLLETERLTRGAIRYRENLDEQQLYIDPSISSVYKEMIPNDY